MMVLFNLVKYQENSTPFGVLVRGSSFVLFWECLLWLALKYDLQGTFIKLPEREYDHIQPL